MSEDIPNSLRHTHQGAQSLNLLGGLSSAALDPEDLEYYDIRVGNVRIKKLLVLLIVYEILVL